MTLEELLALLPDNDTGEIDAADLRTIVTEIWTQSVEQLNLLTVQVQELENRVVALEAGP